MKALIVDDNMINLKVEGRLLESLGVEVDTVQSGKECLEIVKATNYDIIFMDIMMPEMDGVETFQELKKDVDFNTPVVTLTADVVEGARDKYLSLGFTDYISKPTDINLLKEVVDKISMQNNNNN